MRVVSLIASATDIVCALGAGASLVGRSHECAVIGANPARRFGEDVWMRWDQGSTARG